MALILRTLAVLLVGGWLAWAGLVGAIAASRYRQAPELALRYYPDHPVALAAAGNRLQARLGAQASGNPELARIAVRGIQAQALNPQALRQLGMASADQQKSRDAFILSGKMSRRDLTTQLWLIEEAVSREDVAEALRHYDASLRLSDQVQSILFPILTVAMEDPELWDPFIPYLRDPPPWMAAFWNYAINQTAHPEAYAALAERAGGLPDTDFYRDVNGLLLKRLADSGLVREGARFYLTLPNSDRAVLGEAGFTDASTVSRLSPYAWEIYAVPSGVSSSFLRATDADAIRLHSRFDPAVSSAIARKLLLVSPGRYRFSARQWLDVESPDARATWEIRCGGPDGALLWSESSPLDTEPLEVRASVVVTERCPAVTVRLLANSGSGTEGTEMVFGDVGFERE